MRDPERSYRRLSDEDLLRLAQIARADREDFFQRNPRYKPLADQVFAVALCQGAGLHYVDGKTGIKDLDVWTFYAAHAKLIYPWRRPIHAAGLRQSEIRAVAGSSGVCRS